MRYKGSVEQARKDLVAMGFTAKQARDKAPALADARDRGKDAEVRPYSWLGGKANERPLSA